MNIPVTSGNLLEQFARTLMTSLDGNRDGQLSTTEFTAFLTSVMGGAVEAGEARDVGPGLDSHFKNGPHPLMAGFDPACVANPTTVKYKFAQVTQQYSLTSVRDMGSAETLLQAMKPELEAAGITVLGVSRDKIQVLDDRGQTAWVDVIRGAGDYDPAFQWSDTRAG
jgi:hypothetical protein